MITADIILDFWFGQLDKHGYVAEDRSGLWWKKDAKTDAVIRNRFEAHLLRAASGQLDSWGSTPTGRLALIITFDQFPRNVYRGTPQTYAYDEKARQLSLEGLKRRWDLEVPLIQRVFYYMPLEHAEDVRLQERSVERFAALHTQAPPKLKGVFDYYLQFAYRHKEIIDRFGRFPHRNDVLGRVSTPDERVFLEQPDSGF